MKAWDIVAYTFDGDIYHPKCVPDGWKAVCDCKGFDENSLCMNNCHGYGPTVVFASQMEEEEVCGHCGDSI